MKRGFIKGICLREPREGSNNQVHKGFSFISFICSVTIQLIYFIYSLLNLMDGQSFSWLFNKSMF